MNKRFTYGPSHFVILAFTASLFGIAVGIYFLLTIRDVNPKKAQWAGVDQLGKIDVSRTLIEDDVYLYKGPEMPVEVPDLTNRKKELRTMYIVYIEGYGFVGVLPDPANRNMEIDFSANSRDAEDIFSDGLYDSESAQPVHITGQVNKMNDDQWDYMLYAIERAGLSSEDAKDLVKMDYIAVHDYSNYHGAKARVWLFMLIWVGTVVLITVFSAVRYRIAEKKEEFVETEGEYEPYPNDPYAGFENDPYAAYSDESDDSPESPNSAYSSTFRLKDDD